MKNVRIVLLLLLIAFIAPMGFNEPAFATSKLNVTKLFNTLDEIKAQIQTLDGDVSTDHAGLLTKLDEIKAQIQTLDGDVSTDHAGLLTKLNEIKAQIQTLDGDVSTDHAGLLTKLNEIQALINTNHDILEDIDAATSESCPDSWKKVLPDNERFEVVMGGAAVLDKETCLVWEQSPSATTMDWYGAIFHCYNMNLGGRGGWRLPTVEELRSLVDPTQNSPALPVGHPFLNVQSDWYWSATTLANLTSNAWVVYFFSGVVNFVGKSNNFYVWCVRGGHGYDAY